MNTKYFLIFFFTAFSFQVSSQDYDPIIKEGSFWDVIEDGGAGASCPYLYKYRLAGDFVYNGITYKKLEVAPIRGEENPDILCGPTGTLFVNENDFETINGKYIREDINEKKVYILVNKDGIYNEYVMANFNLNVGDLFENAYSDGDINPSNPLKVTQLFTLSDGRKRYYLDNDQSFEEGVGNVQGPIFEYHWHLGGPYYEVYCFGNLQNQNNCATVLSAGKHKLSSIKIFPNPVKNILTVKNTENITIKVFSITGSLLKKSTSKSDIEINLSSFNAGIYILEVSNLTGKKRSKILKL
jgi:hypothetical protein